MFRVVLLGFLVFSVSLVVMPTQVYAISLDDDEEDAEDVADLLDEAKKAGKSESFSKADALLKNGYWSCHANGMGSFSVNGNQAQAANGIVQRSR